MDPNHLPTPTPLTSAEQATLDEVLVGMNATEPIEPYEEFSRALNEPLTEVTKEKEDKVIENPHILARESEKLNLKLRRQIWVEFTFPQGALQKEGIKECLVVNAVLARTILMRDEGRSLLLFSSGASMSEKICSIILCYKTLFEITNTTQYLEAQPKEMQSLVTISSHVLHFIMAHSEPPEAFIDARVSDMLVESNRPENEFELFKVYYKKMLKDRGANQTK